jgi:hypothetical protein
VPLEDSDTNSPSNVNDSDICPTIILLAPHPANIITDSSCQRSLFASAQLRYEIVRSMNGVQDQMSYDRVRTTTQALTHALRELAASLHGNNAEAVFKHNLADLLVRRFLLCLHRPLAFLAHERPELYLSRKKSLDAAMAILSAKENASFSHLVSVGGGLFKMRIIQASLAVASELLRELQEAGPMLEPTAYQRMLLDAADEALRQTAARIRLGATNADVKMHMKLSMVQCQINITTAPGGEPLIQHLARSAKASLEASTTILQSRLPEQEEEFVAATQDTDHGQLPLDLDCDFDDIFRMFDMNRGYATDHLLPMEY